MATTGRVTDGIINKFPIRNSNGTGRLGRVTNIGKNRKDGMFKIIQPNPSSRGSK
jgi:hypothetical protein